MTRLELLRKEKDAVNKLRCLSFDLMDKVNEHYQTEIDAIEVYGCPNNEVKERSEQ